LLTLQKNPDTSEFVIHAQRDSEGRFGYEFSPGYLVYWRIVRDEFGGSLQSGRIEVLAVLKTNIEFSESPEEPTLEQSASIDIKPDSIERVYSRSTSFNNIAMWGTLHVSRNTGKVKGWIVDSWSQGGPPYLHPKMHWVSFPDYRLHHMSLNVDFNSTMQVGSEDTETEPERVVFIRATLRQWEQDWIEEQSKKLP
jgi:hypothetical protein